MFNNNELLNGWIILYKPNGFRYAGEQEYGQLNGRGVLYNKKGDKYAG